MALEVIGAGFGRTGTETLKTALEMLGFAPCYHMFTLIDKHQEHTPVWEKAFTGSTDIDWDFLYKGYRAAVDFPTAAFAEQLAAKYENAKVILTVRDPEQWFASASTTIFPATLERRRGKPNVIDMLFQGRQFEKDHAISVFNAHIRRMKEVLPPERLLVYHVQEGWEPLCRFLGVMLPKEAFPHANSQTVFLETRSGQLN